MYVRCKGTIYEINFQISNLLNSNIKAVIMRVIKFRGQRTENKEWICGDLAHIYNRIPCIMPEWCMSSVPDDEEMKRNKEMLLGGFMEVIPETVGQFTGLHDMVGNEIYEGDVLEEIQDGEKILYTVEWGADGFIADGLDNVNLCLVYENCKVIGNIHDNPELNK